VYQVGINKGIVSIFQHSILRTKDHKQLNFLFMVSSG